MRPDDDMDALIAWLKEQALEARNAPYLSSCNLCPYTKDCDKDTGGDGCIAMAYERFANRVIAKIENSRVSQHPHLPQGWDEV